MHVAVHTTRANKSGNTRRASKVRDESICEMVPLLVATIAPTREATRPDARRHGKIRLAAAAPVPLPHLESGDSLSPLHAPSERDCPLRDPSRGARRLLRSRGATGRPRPLGRRSGAAKLELRKSPSGVASLFLATGALIVAIGSDARAGLRRANGCACAPVEDEAKCFSCVRSSVVCNRGSYIRSRTSDR